MDPYTISPETGMPRVAVSTVINNLIVQNGMASTRERSAQMDAFIGTVASGNTMIIEVLKGMLANRSA